MLTSGTVLRDSYLIMRPLGQGGMGAVYLARHQRLGSTVAVKETFFNDVALLKAFEHEARLLAGLRHPALPKVIDHFPEGGGHFLVMEFISGDDLADILQKRGCAFPVSQVLEWGDQLLSALEYLHKQVPPVIHRDIKPQNLKLTEDGQLVLLDFGLAKGYAEGMSQVASGQSIQAYTPDYAPLEQMQGIGTDPRSDLYSLAATLYHLMTGFTPVNAINRAAVVVTGQPDPLQPASLLNPQVPPLVAEVITRAMLLNRDQRPATAAVMRVMLREAAGHQPGAGIVPVMPNAGATLIAASDTNPNSQPKTNPMSSPLAQPYAPQSLSVSHPAAPTAWTTHQPEQTTTPRPAPALPQVERKGNRITWIAIGLAVLLFVGILPGPGPYPFALRLLMYPPFLALLMIGVFGFGYAMILRLQSTKSPELERKGNALPWAALGLAVLLLILFIRFAPLFGFGFVSRALLGSLWLVVLLMIGATVAVFVASRKNSTNP